MCKIVVRFENQFIESHKFDGLLKSMSMNFFNLVKYSSNV